MSKRWMRTATAVGAVMALVLAGCGSDDGGSEDDGADEQADAGADGSDGDTDDTDDSEDDADAGGETDGSDGERPFEGETLTVLNWNDYGSDQEYAIDGFEERTGATVEHVNHSGSDEVRQILRTGGVGEIDVVLPNPTYLGQLQEEGLIQPIDTSKLENLDKVYENFMNVEDLYIDDELHGVPWVWGSTGLTYNTDEYDEPASWDVLWDPANAGEVAFMDSPEEAIMLAALYLGDNPHDPDLDAVEDALVELRDNIQTYWGSGDDFSRAFTSGSVTIGNFWGGNAGSLMEQGEPIGYTIPEEGAVGWLSTWAVVQDAPNPDLAHAWIDWMISTEFLTTWANDPEGGAPAPATAEATEQLPDDVVARVQAYPEQADRLAIMQSISPERQQEYTDLWTQVKAGAS